MSTRFPLSPVALEICQDAVSTWGQSNCPGQNLDEQVQMLAARVNSWVTGSSVVAGVHDVISCQLPQNPAMKASIEELGTRLAHRLMEEGLLIASPRRAGNLG